MTRAHILPAADIISLVEISYASRERAPTEARVEIDGSLCMLTFPLSPAWQALFPVVFSFGMVLMFLVACGILAQQWTSMRFPPVGILRTLGLIFGGNLLVHAIFGVMSLRAYLQHGHLPRYLSVNRVENTLSHRGERTKRHRAWTLRSIKEVRLQPLKTIIFGGQKVELTIHVRGRVLPLRWRGRQHDASAVAQFAEFLRRACSECATEDPAPHAVPARAQEL